MPDTTPDHPNQIVVTDGAATTTVMTAARYILAAIASFAIGKGWISGDVAQTLTAAVLVIAPTVYGVFKAFTNKQKLLTTAAAAPDRVAKVV